MKTKYTLNETAEILGISRSNLYKKTGEKKNTEENTPFAQN